jgi:hypothetical protein
LPGKDPGTPWIECLVGPYYYYYYYYYYVFTIARRNISNKRRDSSVGIALGYGLDDRGCRVRFPAGAGNFSLYHLVQNGSGAQPAYYLMGARGSLPGGKVAGA